MAQQKKNTRGKQSPKYSAGTLELRFVVGLVLVALGVLIFLAAGLQLEGSVFDAIRALSCGLCGSVTILFPVIPIWGGVLLILSTQKKTSPRELLLVSGLYLIVATCMTLVVSTTYNGQTMSLMDYLLKLNSTKYNPADSFQLFISRGWELGRKSTGGGALGMLLAWPLWKTIGIIPGVILMVLLAAADAVVLFRVDVKKLFNQAQQQVQARDQRKQIEQDELRQRELQWEQQHASDGQWNQPSQPQYEYTPPIDQWGAQPQPTEQTWQTQPQVTQPRPVTSSTMNGPSGFRPTTQEQYVQASPEDMIYEQADYTAALNRGQNPSTKKNISSIFGRKTDKSAPMQSSATGETWKNPDAPHRAAFQKDQPVQSQQQQTWQENTQPVQPVQPQQTQWQGNTQPVQPQQAQWQGNTQPVQPVQSQQTQWQSNTQPVQPVQSQQAQWQNNTQPVQPVQPQQAQWQNNPQPTRPAQQQPAQRQPQPARPAPSHTYQNDSWNDGSSYSTASWREDGNGQNLRQATGRYHAAAQTASPMDTEEETPITRKLHQMQQTREIEPDQSRPSQRQAPVNTQLRMKEVPPATVDDTPPWEDRPARSSSPAPVAVPHLQVEPPKDAWKPELKLPPRKDDPTEEEEEKPVEIPYIYPNYALIKMPEPASSETAEEDALRSRRLEETLQSFKVPAKVKHVTHGPAISRFELEIASGIRVNKITDLDRNIAMNMEVKSVRIEAPIPGKSLVGVEVPNHRVSKVTLREVLDTPAMQAAKSPLCVALGKDIAGTPIICDLAKMPHLLIAGATGSGKSVCVNAMINSILFRASPKEVRMILVDPKVVELQCYNNIPHLLIPVVSDPHKAAGALEWAVAEMMERYNKFQKKGVREITGYNSKLEEGEEYMPRIVIIIDELADLMMTCRKDVEERICRLAQLARAAGIHLVVATQRPSVDVITGLIKANIPSRIAFKVSSYVDSRTILDRPGAEKLLGYGDMLYLPNGEFTPIRVQGCFLTDEEVNNITDFIRRANPSEYDPNVIEQLESMQNANNGELAADEITSADDDSNSDANLLQQAIEMTVQDGQTSTSMLQRRLRIGYARAGRLVDEMEKRGIVSQKDGAKPRMCLISREEFEQLKQSGTLEE